MAFKSISASKRNDAPATAQTREPSEFDGLWINFGRTVERADEEGNPTEKFVRMQRGVAVSDLEEHKIYATTNPEWKADATLINQITQQIRKKGLTLEEGESVTLNLDVVLYRKQEAVETVAVDTIDEDALAEDLFG